MDPVTVKYRYRNPLNGRLGIENSPAFYKNYMFFADNGGLLQCIDLNEMKPVWLADMSDDTDSTIVLEETAEGVFIYASNEFDLRGAARKKEIDAMAPEDRPSEIIMDSHVKKFNAMTGALVWETVYKCHYDSYINGGSLATVLLGKDDISDRIIVNIAKTGSKNGGRLAALDKKTGLEIWGYDLPNYSWSSPVAIYDESAGKTYFIVCDFSGMMRLVDPIDGKLINEVSLGANIESTPAVYGDIAVVGSYAKKIFGVRIK
ncbi:MAG: hypothetical protein R6W99_00610 [Clostridia bacterium]